ncbi:hypothetical protein MNBD_GAMMA10-189 [hydrothermal vent metagenome]|uniref:Uncharacterized protein n=1 Tax=hydrothermal vent metagenome TaxID=652676 RepID=A0A3B0YBQ6_9ZZZZ
MQRNVDMQKCTSAVLVVVVAGAGERVFYTLPDMQFKAFS